MPADRIHALDTLRGLMLVIMAVDHLDLYGPVYRITYETFGFVSAAEGFVLLSGIVAGVVYGGYAQTPGRLGTAVRRRLAMLWRYHLVIVAGLFVAWLLGVTEGGPGGAVEAVMRGLGGALLLNQEAPLDILPLYLLFVAILPFVLLGFRRGRAALVLAVAAGCWLLDQLLTPLDGYPVTIRFTMAGISVAWQPNHFHLLAWTLLFVVGVWAGWRVRHGAAGLPRPVPARWVVAAAVVAGVCLALRHGILVAELSRQELAVAGVNLGWLRLVNVAAVALLMTAAAQRWPQLFRRPWLERLGRHALLVFTWQTLLQIYLASWYAEAAARWGPEARLAILAAAAASLALPAIWRERGLARRARSG